MIGVALTFVQKFVIMYHNISNQAYKKNVVFVPVFTFNNISFLHAHTLTGKTKGGHNCVPLFLPLAFTKK